ncbi:hypothetical protein J1614_002997 [Plenodomus biglobosus]|nr:hypothetical protein J1614_002997 [Plenodomus biglobosus]
MPLDSPAGVVNPYERILNAPGEPNKDPPHEIASGSVNTMNSTNSSPAKQKKEVLPCITCAKIGRALDCCKSGPCDACTDIGHAFNEQHLTLKIWKDHCNKVKDELMVCFQQFQRHQQVSQEKDNVIAEMKMARTHLEGQHRRQIQTQNMLIMELRNDRQLLRDKLPNNGQEPDHVEHLTKKCRKLEDMLEQTRREFDSNMETLRDTLKEKYAKEMEEHIKKDTCMTQDYRKSLLDESNGRAQGLNAHSLNQQMQEKDEYIGKLNNQLQALREAFNQQRQEKDDHIKSLTIRLQAVQEQKALQGEEQDAKLAKLKKELANMRVDLAEETQNHRETGNRLSKDLKEFKDYHELYFEALTNYVLEQKAKHEQELKDHADVSAQQIRSLQEKLDHKEHQEQKVEKRLLPLREKQEPQAQEEGDYIEGLKQQCQEASEEDKGLSKLLEERKTMLLRLQSQQQGQQPIQFVIKEPKNKKGKGRKK